MATVVLQAVGSVVGGALGGPLGATLGRALGAVAGSVVDQRLFGPGDRTIEGPRLDGTQVLSSREGTPIPRAFGQVRVSGEIIWATRFMEVQSVETQSQGGKSGRGSRTSVKSYAYYGNFAIALCEGPIACIRRIWADGTLLDRRNTNVRIYTGHAEQLPDSLISAKQGAGNTPAYRGTAYVVFDHLPLADYGNRFPQIAVEVVRPLGRLERHVHAVNMIPGATEFGYDTQVVSERIDEVETRMLNVNQSFGHTDFLASLDELVAICPNLKQIALIVTWFGNDLRAGHCEIYPAVETSHRDIVEGEEWLVAGLAREEARLVSRIDGRPAYGGTPSDNSVIRAIHAIRERGLKVCLTPFIMMDVPADNGLPDPYGGAQQAVYPWRGRITCHPAPGQPNSTDGTAAAGAELQALVGQANTSQITVQGDRVDHGSLTEWSYRRLILHYARLAQLAGGVDMFLVGSEMRGVSTVRDGQNDFPFVSALQRLAQEAKAILGAGCTVTYGADWSEYFGYHPADGSDDHYFHLDPLWASLAIDAVGIDNYMPLSDWRRDGAPDDDARASVDQKALLANVAGGEGYDWYYRNAADREAGTRTPIADGAAGKPWVFRYKDLKGWWDNQHYDRVGGVEVASPTAWTPRSKPIIFTELGCPAVDGGSNQPNVFHDPKSAESALPYFSNGGRDDASTFAYIEVSQKYWDWSYPGFVPARNPVSDAYGGHMLDFEHSAFWAWDARPFPAFPDRRDLWSDHDNWTLGHWLTGRLGSVRLADLIAELLTISGVEAFDVSKVYEAATGYLVADTASFRDALEVLVNLFRLSVFEDGGVLYFQSPGRDDAVAIDTADIVFADGTPSLMARREQEIDLPESARLHHIDPVASYRDAETQTRRTNGASLNQHRFSAPLVIEPNLVQTATDAWLHDRWSGRETIEFSLPRAYATITPGDQLQFSDDPKKRRWLVRRVETGVDLQISARSLELQHPRPARAERRVLKQSALVAGPPLVRFLDLPILPDRQGSNGNLVAATARPWPGELAVYSSSTPEDLTYRQTIANAAFMGELTSDLPSAAAFSRWDRAAQPELRLYTGELVSVSRLSVFSGGNALAVRSRTGDWELLQFQSAQLTGARQWRVSNLLRGQAGTENEAEAGAAAGAELVILNSAVEPLETNALEQGAVLKWQIGPTGGAVGDPAFLKAEYAPGHRGEVPFSPVHLRARSGATGNLLLSWIRRNRLDADDWQLVDIPNSEASERYSVSITGSVSGAWQAESDQPSLTISAPELTDAFGTDTQILTIAVAQISATRGPGPAAKVSIPRN